MYDEFDLYLCPVRELTCRDPKNWMIGATVIDFMEDALCSFQWRMATKAATGKPNPRAQRAPAAGEDEGLDPTQYFENGFKFLAAQKELGKNPYPHKFQVLLTVPNTWPSMRLWNLGSILRMLKFQLLDEL